MAEQQKKLARNVTVGSETYGPDDNVPADVLKQIDNPAAFEESDDTTPAEKTARELSRRSLDSDLSKSGK